MKKASIYFFFFFMFFPMFAISNFTMYEWNSDNGNEIIGKIEGNYIYEYYLGSFYEEPCLKIENSELLEIPDNNFYGTVVEENGKIIISFISDNDKIEQTYNKKNGYCIKEVFIFDGKLDSESYYFPETGSPDRKIEYIDGIIFFESFFDKNSYEETKCIYYDDSGNLETIELYDFSIPNIDITNVFDKNNELIEIITKEIGDNKFPLKKTKKNNKNIITEISLYNGTSYDPYDQVIYYDDGKIKKELKGDYDSGKYAYLNIYSESGSKTEYKFIQFDEESNFKVDSNFVINTSITSHFYMNGYAKESETDYVDWNEHYYALVSKYDFNVRDSEFRYLRYLKDQKYLIQSNSVIIYNPNNSYLLCFSIIDFEIDFDSCYKIELIEKPSF